MNRIFIKASLLISASLMFAGCGPQDFNDAQDIAQTADSDMNGGILSKDEQAPMPPSARVAVDAQAPSEDKDDQDSAGANPGESDQPKGRGQMPEGIKGHGHMHPGGKFDGSGHMHAMGRPQGPGAMGVVEATGPQAPGGMGPGAPAAPGGAPADDGCPAGGAPAAGASGGCATGNCEIPPDPDTHKTVQLPDQVSSEQTKVMPTEENQLATDVVDYRTTRHIWQPSERHHTVHKHRKLVRRHFTKNVFHPTFKRINRVVHTSSVADQVMPTEEVVAPPIDYGCPGVTAPAPMPQRQPMVVTPVVFRPVPVARFPFVY